MPTCDLLPEIDAALYPHARDAADSIKLIFARHEGPEQNIALAQALSHLATFPADCENVLAFYLSALEILGEVPTVKH